MSTVKLIHSNKNVLPSDDQVIITAAIEGAATHVMKAIEELNDGTATCANPMIPPHESTNCYTEALLEVLKAFHRSSHLPGDDIPF